MVIAPVGTSTQATVGVRVSPGSHKWPDDVPWDEDPEHQSMPLTLQMGDVLVVNPRTVMAVEPVEGQAAAVLTWRVVTGWHKLSGEVQERIARLWTWPPNRKRRWLGDEHPKMNALVPRPR